MLSFAIWNTHIIVNFSCISCFELMLCSVELIHSWDLVEFFKTLKFAQKGNWGACPKQLRHPKAVIRHTTKGNFASHDRFITLFPAMLFFTSTILRYLRYRNNKNNGWGVFWLYPLGQTTQKKPQKSGKIPENQIKLGLNETVRIFWLADLVEFILN